MKTLAASSGGALRRYGAIGLMAGMMVVTYGFLLASPPMERMLGRTGVIVITRLLGMLLAALSVQFVIDGVKGTGLIG